MANGGFANISLIGKIMTDPEVRDGKKASYAQVDVAEWPARPDDDRTRGLIRISLKLRPEQRPPKKGTVVYVASGTYYRNPGKPDDDGKVIYFHNLTGVIWEVLPVGKTPDGSAPASKPATADKPSQATPPPSSLEDEDEDVPF